jgi:hypothetical protein
MAGAEPQPADSGGCSSDGAGCAFLLFVAFVFFIVIPIMTGTGSQFDYPTPAPQVCDEGLLSAELCADELSEDNINALQAALNEDEQDSSRQAPVRRQAGTHRSGR